MSHAHQPIWQLIRQSAEEMTASGDVPFTRGDLIRGVQRYRPECGPDSINPIIQGLTDNLQGGAASGCTRPLLHSVGRGQFVLAAAGEVESLRTRPRGKPARSREVPDLPAPKVEGKKIRLLDTAFTFVCEIIPERDENGQFRRLTPQSRYQNVNGLALHRFGEGPFCRFRIPSQHAVAGVYVLTVDRVPKYVGECFNLSQRYNMGYGQISPRNCFVGGQETNCRLNNQILEAAEAGNRIELWFHQCEAYKALESELRSKYRFPWNRI